METLFRRHFWIFHLLFLSLAAWLVAGGITSVVGSQLKGEPSAEVPAADATAADTQTRTRNFNVPNEANIFGALREDLTVPEAECESDADCPTGSCDEGQCVDEGDTDGPIPELADAVRSSLRGRLVGTAVFADPKFSVASIVDENAGRNAEAELYSVNPCDEEPPPPPPPAEGEEDLGAPIARPLLAPCNELMDVATIKYIEPNRVYFYNREERRWEYFDLGEEPEGPAVAGRRKPAAKAPAAAADLGEGIRKTGDNAYEVDQTEVDKALGNLSSLATQARIVPAFEGGQPVGFKLFSIRPNSLYSKIGIQNGDVIKRINGYDINSPDKALEVYQKLKDSKSVTVDLKRRGKPMSLEYGIVP